MAKRRRAGVLAPPEIKSGERKRSSLKFADKPVSKAVRLSHIGAWATLPLATLVVYLPALRGSLLWDDSGHITKRELQSLQGLWRIWFELGATQQYYPFLHSAFWMEHRIWGDAVLGYHLTNIALHALSACLVVMIAKRLALPGAWLAGFIFALHPVCVEAVAWISEQKSVLSGVFYLGAALTYLSFDRTRRPSRYFLAFGLFLLALLTKTVTATLPAALLVILWWLRGRLDWKRDILPLCPWLALGASAGLFTAWVEATLIGAHGKDFDLTLIQRVLLAGRVIWFYAGKLVWPSNLTFTYPHWTIDSDAWRQYLPMAGVTVLGIGLWLLARRHRGPLAGFMIFVGTLFPVLGFLNVYPFRYSFVADHFQYLASLGIVVPAASGLTLAAQQISLGKGGHIAFPVILLLTLGVLTWRQSTMYQDSETLYRETLLRNPTSWMAHYNLGTALADMPGRLPEAISEFEAALRVKPDYAKAHYNLGEAWSRMPGRLPDAITEYQAALRIQPDYPKAHYDLGAAWSRMPGRLPDAITEYQAALRVQPDYAEAHDNLGSVLAQIPGRLPEAIAEYQAALRIRPDYARAHYNLAIALSQIPGRLPDAILEYEAALRIAPGYAKAHYNLGNALVQTGRLPDAIAEYEAALRIDPEYAEAHNNLGSSLLQMNRLQDAIEEYQAALRIQPSYARAHYNLASALSQIPGRLPKAIAECESALRISPDLEPARQLMYRLRRGQQ
jgi:tetratricopeptide (TPR) repeat protein